MTRKPVGIKDVAAAAGVSVTTVSEILNDVPHSRAAEATRERVRSTAQRLGYRPNRLARSLRTRSTGMIGLLTEEIATTPYAGRIILGAQEAAAEHGLILVIINSPLLADADARRDDVRALLDRQVDGIVYATVYHDVVSPPAELRTSPAVLIGARDRAGTIPSIVPDEEQGVADAVFWLHSLGHRRIGYLSVSALVPATRRRPEGYQRAMTELGLAPLVVEAAESDAASGYEASLAMLAGSDRPTAVLCYDDRVAWGLYRGAAELGLEIPRDVSVVGFDDQDPIPRSLAPMLATVGLPHYEMGAWAVQRLVAQIKAGPEGATAESGTLPCPLIDRESVARVAPPR